MLIVNDKAFHQRTGKMGRVIGYGHQMVNGYELRTLKVRVNEGLAAHEMHSIVEDLASRWMPLK